MQNLLQLAVEAAVAGGLEIMEVYNQPSMDVTTKSDNSPLTIADQRAHHTIVNFLSSTPYPILSEEGKAIPFETRSKWSRFWMVDPLDGTKEFIKRNGEFTVNIALIENGSPILGVIYVPVQKLLYFGLMGTGAYRKYIHNQSDLHAPLMESAQHLPLSKTTQLTVVGSRSHLSVETEDFIKALEKNHGPSNFASMGSSLKICMVAEGTADIYPRFAPTMEWDTAAGQGIALAAGCVCLNAHTRGPLEYNKPNLLNDFFIVSNQRYALPSMVI